MKKVITIISEVDVPVKHLFNQEKWNIYETVGRDDLFTITKKDESISKETIEEE